MPPLYITKWPARGIVRVDNYEKTTLCGRDAIRWRITTYGCEWATLGRDAFPSEALAWVNIQERLLKRLRNAETAVARFYKKCGVQPPKHDALAGLEPKS